MQERHPNSLPPQHQDHQPGDESEMVPRPDFMPRQAGSGRLKGKIALITGGDSGRIAVEPRLRYGLPSETS